MRVIDPNGSQKPAEPIKKPLEQPPQPALNNPEIQRLATNDDLNVATIAREAHKATEGPKKDPGDGEVVISLR